MLLWIRQLSFEFGASSSLFLRLLLSSQLEISQFIGICKSITGESERAGGHRRNRKMLTREGCELSNDFDGWDATREDYNSGFAILSRILPEALRGLLYG